MSLEHELAELSTAYQLALEKTDTLELQVNALDEQSADLQQLVRDYDGLLLLVLSFSLLPEITVPQALKWYAKARELQERKRELLHE
jgi:hypothetical protein